VGVAALAVARTFSIPIAEVSGLALRHEKGRLELLAIGDTTAELARATLTDGMPERWTVTRLAGVKDRKGSQLEAVAADGDGRIVVLREHPVALLRLDEAGTHVDCELERDVTGDPTWHDITLDDPNSLGEGLAFGPSGEVVLAKEKRPSALLRGQLRGDTAVLQRHWLLSPELAGVVRDVSDVTFGPDGRVYLLSDQSRVIVRVGAGWQQAEAISADAVWELPKPVDKAEGLVLLPDGRAMVAVDRKKPKDNLHLLEPAIVSDVHSTQNGQP
jgi:uncharacterized protein YjiK